MTRFTETPCSYCGIMNFGTRDLCVHHAVEDLTWSRENRMLCDFFHRGIEPPRLKEPERQDHFLNWNEMPTVTYGVPF